MDEEVRSLESCVPVDISEVRTLWIEHSVVVFQHVIKLECSRSLFGIEGSDVSGRDGSEVVDKREGARRRDQKRRNLNQEVAGEGRQSLQCFSSTTYLILVK